MQIKEKINPLLFLTTFLLSLLFNGFATLSPITAWATSGACSYHQGVNCAAGPSYYGRVQCNDGWINSSVYFSDAEECKTPLTQCVYPIQPYCSLSDIEERKNATLGTASAMIGRSGGLGSPSGEARFSGIENNYSMESTVCQSQLIAYESQLDRYNECQQNNAILLRTRDDNSNLIFEKIRIRIEKEREEKIDKIFNAEFEKVIAEMPEYKDVVNKSVIKKLTLNPKNSDKTFAEIIEETYSDDLEALKAKSLKRYNKACKANFGEYSFAHPDGKCQCVEGYSPNKLNGQCYVDIKEENIKPVIKIPDTEKKVDNKIPEIEKVESKDTVTAKEVETVEAKNLESVKEMPWYRKFLNWFYF